MLYLVVGTTSLHRATHTIKTKRNIDKVVLYTNHKKTDNYYYRPQVLKQPPQLIQFVFI